MHKHRRPAVTLRKNSQELERIQMPSHRRMDQSAVILMQCHKTQRRAGSAHTTYTNKMNVTNRRRAERKKPDAKEHRRFRRGWTSTYLAVTALCQTAP